MYKNNNHICNSETPFAPQNTSKKNEEDFRLKNININQNYNIGQIRGR